MFSTPLTCCSIGSATVSTIVRAEAPGYRVVTCTVGGVTSGYCATGRENSATPPITSIRIAKTLARTGRSMKYLEIIQCGPHPDEPSAARRLEGWPHTPECTPSPFETRAFAKRLWRAPQGEG